MLNLKVELFYLKRKLSTAITGFFGQKKNLHVGGTVTFYFVIIFVGRGANCEIFIFLRSRVSDIECCPVTIFFARFRKKQREDVSLYNCPKHKSLIAV